MFGSKKKATPAPSNPTPTPTPAQVHKKAVSNTNISPGEEFRRYLEQGGVTDTIKMALHRLYEEKEWPANPTEYVIRRMAERCDLSLSEMKRNELKSAREQIKELEFNVLKLSEELKKCNKQHGKKKTVRF